MPGSGLLAHALFYASRGFSVIPLEPRGKRPLARWQRFQSERASPALLTRWLRRFAEANLAIVTGAVSDLVVLDVDPAHGGADSLKALERRYGRLPHTVEVLTGGGGRHLWFRHPGGFFPNRVGLEPGIDLRGDGGYVVVPPSIHPSGRPYAFEVDRHPEEVAVAAMPVWLRDLVHRGPRREGHPRGYWRALVVTRVEEGLRNTTLASFAGHLIWHGVDPLVIEELLQCWNRVRCRPPLPADEVTRTVWSIVRTHSRHAGRPGGGSDRRATGGEAGR
ncbi:hypothetical protein HRbin40_00824 [bacterium HR40]|nr:hypothetical protein HRbin40_00824 [bacterium HR40]